MNINDGPKVEGGHFRHGKRRRRTKKETEKATRIIKRVVNEEKKNESFTTYRGHNRAIVLLHCTADGYHLLSTSEDGTCRLWDRASGKRVKIVKHPRADAPIASACLAFRNHVEKVIANVGEGVRSSSQHENTTTTTQTVCLRLRRRRSSNAERRSDEPARAPSVRSNATGAFTAAFFWRPTGRL